LKALLGLLAQGFDRAPQVKEPLFGLSNQLDEDVTVATAASAKAPHDFFELLTQVLDLAVEFGAPAAALLSDVVDEL
jgi:hypothetical protein